MIRNLSSTLIRLISWSSLFAFAVSLISLLFPKLGATLASQTQQFEEKELETLSESVVPMSITNDSETPSGAFASGMYSNSFNYGYDSVAHSVIQMQNERYQQHLKLKAKFRRNTSKANQLIHTLLLTSPIMNQSDISEEESLSEDSEALSTASNNEENNVISFKQEIEKEFELTNSQSITPLISDANNNSNTQAFEENLAFDSSQILNALSDNGSEEKNTFIKERKNSQSLTRTLKQIIDEKHLKKNKAVLRGAGAQYINPNFALIKKITVQEGLNSLFENHCAHKKCPCLKFKRKQARIPVVSFQQSKLPTIFENIAY